MMQIANIGSRGILFTFYDLKMPTNVYVINTEDTYFIIDTYLGEEPMIAIVDYLTNEYGDKKKIIVNTHSDWDHIWGNSYFEDNMIIGHVKCVIDIVENGEVALKEYADLKRGFVKLVPPNTILKGNMEFDEGVEIFYSPGHSEDSISVLDKVDSVIYAGDNIEFPIPYIQHDDIAIYLETLKTYEDINADIYIGGHTGIENIEIVKSNLEYLEILINDEEFRAVDEEVASIHNHNINFLNRTKQTN